MRFYQLREIHQLQLPTGLQQWLVADGSLTQQLIKLSNGQFHVIPMNEHYQRLSQIDAMWLNMPAQHIAWVRESDLYGSDVTPWVKAKSIFPILSLNKQARIFKHIGRQPIGHLLFKRTTPLCQRRILKLDEGWTRQSCYTWHGCQFIVQETFLKTFEQFIQK
ncbi:chorismate lyase [Acinetobacter sp.]|uniref:chorismate--pyruvate lyase family protein n=1 Tax=Acinetobacter sp. TaxID=472 RepID=UPI0035B3C94C